MRRFVLAALLFSTLALTAQTGVNTPSLTAVPFSAETVTQTIRVLQDGNRIEQTMHGKLFQDSQGRIRTEMGSNTGYGGGDRRMITIFDPVQRLTISFSISPNSPKIARVHHLGAPVPYPGGVSGSISTKGSQTVEGCPVDTLKTPPKEDLGTRTIEGFTVHGTRFTNTIDAGQIGNEKPIVTTTESWQSTELHQTLENETDNPLSGHQSMKVFNIQLVEPDPSLFQVPPDYTVQENQTQQP